MSIPTGCYTVTNVKHRNLTFLADPNNGTALATSDERGNLEEKWNVNKLSNGNYTFRNVGFASYANSGPGCREGDTVEGRSREQQWAILETDINGQYLIATLDRQLFWGVRGPRSQTPITLSDNDADHCNWWTFKVTS